MSYIYKIVISFAANEVFILKRLIPIKMKLLDKCNYVEWMISLQCEAKKRNVWKWLSIDPNLRVGLNLNNISSGDKYEMAVAQDILFERIAETEVRACEKVFQFPFEMVLELRRQYFIGIPIPEENTSIGMAVRKFKWKSEDPEVELERYLNLVSDQMVNVGPMAEKEQVSYFLQAPRGNWKLASQILYRDGQVENLSQMILEMRKLAMMDERQLISIWGTQNEGSNQEQLPKVKKEQTIKSEPLQSKKRKCEEFNDIAPAVKRTMFFNENVDEFIVKNDENSKKEDENCKREITDQSTANASANEGLVSAEQKYGKHFANMSFEIPMEHDRFCTRCCFVVSNSAPFHTSLLGISSQRYTDPQERLTPLHGKKLLHIQAIGPRMLQTKLIRSLILSDCRLVQKMTVSVFSVKAAKRDGYDVTYDGNTCNVWKDGNLWATTIRILGLDYLQLQCDHKLRKRRISKTKKLLKFVYSTKNRPSSSFELTKLV